MTDQQPDQPEQPTGTSTQGGSTPRTRKRGRSPASRPGKRSAAPAVIVDERVRQERAFQLRLGGLTFQEIADSEHPDEPGRKLYASPSAARTAYLTAVERHAGKAETEELRQLWVQRNERVFRALYPRCLRGELLAIDRYTRLFGEHIAMLGLRKLDVSGQVNVRVEGEWDASYRELTEALTAQAAAGELPPPPELPELPVTVEPPSSG